MGRFRIMGYMPFALVLSSTTTAFSFPGHDLFERQSSCSSGSTQCSGAPSGFCCASTSTCLVLASNTTVLCCPQGSDCTLIQPITCDIQQQNITSHPNAVLLTTNLTGSLPTCGTGCCPYGYTCNGGNSCVVKADQGSAPSQTSTISSTSTRTAVPIAPSNIAPALTSAPAATDSPAAQCNAFPAPAVLAGFFPGLFAGALMAIAGFCALGAHRRKQARLSGSFGKVAASISDPIYNPGSAMRTDFILKHATPQSTPSRTPTIQRVRSLFRKSTAANATEMTTRHSPYTPPVPQAPPVTPRLQREPSGESINIFADPSTAREGSRGRESHQTTFTDMMERADLGGLRKGEPFVPTQVPTLSPQTYQGPPRGQRNR